MNIKVQFAGHTIACDVRDKTCKNKSCLRPHNFHGGISPGRGYASPGAKDWRCGTREWEGCPTNKAENQ